MLSEPTPRASTLSQACIAVGRTRAREPSPRVSAAFRQLAHICLNLNDTRPPAARVSVVDRKYLIYTLTSDVNPNNDIFTQCLGCDALNLTNGMSEYTYGLGPAALGTLPSPGQPGAQSILALYRTCSPESSAQTVLHVAAVAMEVAPSFPLNVDLQDIARAHFRAETSEREMSNDLVRRSSSLVHFYNFHPQERLL